MKRFLVEMAMTPIQLVSTHVLSIEEKGALVKVHFPFSDERLCDTSRAGAGVQSTGETILPLDERV